MKFKQYQFLRKEALDRLKSNQKEMNPFCLYIQNPLSADALMLAYIGDAVYSMFIRERLCATGITKVQVLHNLVTEFICAKSQAKSLLAIEETFNEREQLVARRARNSNVNVPKSSTIQEYRNSTAFEAVLGYLYVIHEKERLEKFMEQAFTSVLVSL